MFWTLVLAALLANGLYLYAAPDASLFYVANVVLHALVGLIAAPFLLRWSWKRINGKAGEGGVWAKICGGSLFVGTLLGLALLLFGGVGALRTLVAVHAVLMCVGTALLPASGRGKWTAAAAIAALAAGAFFIQQLPDASAEIVNPPLPPLDMAGENSLGEQSPFFPSAVETADGKPIPSDFFLNSERCGDSGCHPDIVEQWSGSMHRFSSFNNQWYRRSIEYMQETHGELESSKWCAGCHDPALLLTGMWTKPAAEQLDLPESNAGLGCVACHSASAVKDTMGNGALVYEYPPMHRFAASKSPLMRALHDYVVRLNPKPHKAAFMKTFHTEQTSEFCSACHKAHLDEPVNKFRWVRGFDEYGAWQASGVSGQGALSFYYPPKPSGCGDCHMPLVPSNDAGNIDGYVHSHRFPGANTALPHAWNDAQQMKATVDFLKANAVTIDIFAMTAGKPPVEASPSSTQSRSSALRSATLSGDETTLLHGAAGGWAADVRQLTAPLNLTKPALRRGDSARVSVVVRTRGIGHRFPGGTFDAFDVWLELKAEDENGQLLFLSGGLEQDGQVDRGAHFYRAALVDAEGNLINKRNAWAARALLYARGIPPGAADAAHFRLDIPEECGDTLTLKARLLYRKFHAYNTAFSYAGAPDDSGDVSVHHDSRVWRFDRPAENPAGLIKKTPNLPAVALAEDAVQIQILPADAPAPAPQTAETKEMRERWNDYGIGLLLQTDLKGARAVFEKVTRMDPAYPDGWINAARSAVQEGDWTAAKGYLTRARALLEKTPPDNPHRAKGHYFWGVAALRQGDFETARRSFEAALGQYPRDMKVLNQLGRTRFLMRDFAASAEVYRRTLVIDPENLTAHYNLMLAYQGLGDREKARRHQAYYRRFKADESKQAITGAARRASPELNLERQAIREHYDMPREGALPLPDGRRLLSPKPPAEPIRDR
ncbi:MAG: tetratricopeptide repeat protein [Candidatus Poribacteria bacterium]|nr:tetratricopeptide repeat protein [Candidatus Poribacteria bacterium]